MKATKILLLTALSSFFALNSFSQTWTNTGAPIAAWNSIASSADGAKLIAAASRLMVFSNTTTPVGIYLSTNSGAAWVRLTNLSMNCLASSADGTRLVAANSSILVSTNSGATWTNSNAPSDGYIGYETVASSADGRVLVAGGMSVYFSTNFEATWSSAGIAGDSVACSADGTKLYAAQNETLQLIFVSTNSGVTWKSHLPTAAWTAIACSADGTKAVAVAANSIYISTNSGMSWIKTNAISASWSSVAMSADGNEIMAVAQGKNFIYTSTNSGALWISNSVPTNEWLCAAMSADGNKLFAGAEPATYVGGIFTSQMTPSPQMNISPTNGNLKLSWLVPSTNFVLQSSVDLPSWMDLTDQPVLNFTNLQDEVYLSPSNGNIFYRLKTP